MGRDRDNIFKFFMNEIDAQKNNKRKNPLKTKLVQSHQERINKYIAEEASVIDFLNRNPDAPTKSKEADREDIRMKIERLEEIFIEIMPYVLKIRGYIPCVLD
jgi:hypothetical protein